MILEVMLSLTIALDLAMFKGRRKSLHALEMCQFTSCDALDIVVVKIPKHCSISFPLITSKNCIIYPCILLSIGKTRFNFWLILRHEINIWNYFIAYLRFFHCKLFLNFSENASDLVMLKRAWNATLIGLQSFLVLYTVK